MKKKRNMTLLEIMIVIFLIGLISTVIGYNMKGSLDEGKAFKTKQAQMQVKDLLLLEVAKGARIEEVVKHPEIYLKQSGLAKNEKELLKDGWGSPFMIRVTKDRGDIEVTSKNLTNFEKKKKKSFSNDESHDEDY